MKELIEKLELLKDKLINSEDIEFIGQFKIIHQAIQALSQSEGEKEIYDIDFNGHVLARIEIINNNPTIIASMNGYGNAVDLDKITITPQTK